MFSCTNLLMKHWNAVFESFGVDEEGGMSVEIRQFPNTLTGTVRTVEDGTWGGGECAAPDEDGYGAGYTVEDGTGEGGERDASDGAGQTVEDGTDDGTAC